MTRRIVLALATIAVSMTATMGVAVGTLGAPTHPAVSAAATVDGPPYCCSN